MVFSALRRIFERIFMTTFFLWNFRNFVHIWAWRKNPQQNSPPHPGCIWRVTEAVLPTDTRWSGSGTHHKPNSLRKVSPQPLRGRHLQQTELQQHCFCWSLWCCWFESRLYHWGQNDYLPNFYSRWIILGTFCVCVNEVETRWELIMGCLAKLPYLNLLQINQVMFSSPMVCRAQSFEGEEIPNIS